jgi:hypothetical protein
VSIKSLVGERFGRLVVTSFSHREIKNGNYSYFWTCDCDCGTKNFVTSSSNLMGKTTSCGCYHLEVLGRNKKHNTYEFVDDYVVGYTEKGEKFFFDKEDYDLILSLDSYWFLEDEYVRVRLERNKERKRISMHHLVLGIDEKVEIDHINTHAYDNRKSNLRIADKSKNGMNIGLRKNNTSGATGVYRIRKKWGAQITYEGKVIYLGIYDTFEEAVAARKEAEQKYFGEFAYRG